ncbi:hypothetical protein FS842_000811 [Serendipita sp. 407]|nr:hypothetical protein FRC20_007958 [Serendipita sp. 405]KAG9046718.1 hypothetical protein FS842_000811 [Serendipita sp. 407]
MSQSRDQPEPFVRHGDVLEAFLQNFWQRQVDAAESEPPPYGRHPPLPLARIKKVMKSDPEVRMIASDAPVLFCKACEIFIQEITCRAFLVADAHKRRTISKADIAKALAKSDHFDFLIDVVPRDEVERAKTQRAINSGLEAEAKANEERAAVEQAASMGSSSHGGVSGPQLSPQVHQQPSLAHGPPASMYQQPHMGMSHMMHQSMHPQSQIHQSSSMHHPQHQRALSGSHPHVHGQSVPPVTPMIPPMNISMTAHTHARAASHSHSHSHSQSQPPPLIPTTRTSNPGQSHHQQQQAPNQHGNSRRQSVNKMSLSPTIPLSTSRMDSNL